jgi:hypothetical protein
MDIPRAVLEPAKQEANYVAQEAGFSLNWIDCRQLKDTCFSDLGPDDVVLLFRKGSRPGEVGKYSEAGEAVVDRTGTGMYSMIYYDEVQRQAARSPVSEGVLLGYVIVHEIGHLMGLRHAHEGVMVGNWGPREMALMAVRSLHFKASECRRIQAEIQAKQKLASDDIAQLARVLAIRR